VTLIDEAGLLTLCDLITMRVLQQSNNLPDQDCGILFVAAWLVFLVEFLFGEFDEVGQLDVGVWLLAFHLSCDGRLCGGTIGAAADVFAPL
jgi:hypothetical protein